MSPTEMADKYGISLGNVYTIKATAKRTGVVTRSGRSVSGARIENENSVFTAGIRDRIKDMREQDYTSSEITQILNEEGMKVSLQDVNKVMARAAYDPRNRG